jgi:hypothetical protein
LAIVLAAAYSAETNQGEIRASELFAMDRKESM